MAFCTKCGKELKEGEVCSCQQEVVQAEEVQPEVKETSVDKPVELKKEEAPANSAKKSKLPMIVGVGAVAVVLILIFIFGGKGYKKPLDQYVDLVNKKTVDQREWSYVLMGNKQIKLKQKLEKAYMKSEEYADSVEKDMENCEEKFADCDDELGKWKFSYELKNTEKLDEDDIKKYQKNLKNYYKEFMKEQIEEVEDTLDDEDELEDMADDLDISEKEAEAIAKAQIKLLQSYENMEISKGYELKVKFHLKSSEEEYKSDTVRVIVLKVNGEWVYAGPSNGYITFEDSMVNFMVSKLNSSFMYQ